MRGENQASRPASYRIWRRSSAVAGTSDRSGAAGQQAQHRLEWRAAPPRSPPSGRLHSRSASNAAAPGRFKEHVAADAPSGAWESRGDGSDAAAWGARISATAAGHDRAHASLWPPTARIQCARWQGAESNRPSSGCIFVAQPATHCAERGRGRIGRKRAIGASRPPSSL